MLPFQLDILRERACYTSIKRFAHFPLPTFSISLSLPLLCLFLPFLRPRYSGYSEYSVPLLLSHIYFALGSFWRVHFSHFLPVLSSFFPSFVTLSISVACRFTSLLHPTISSRSPTRFPAVLSLSAVLPCSPSTSHYYFSHGLPRVPSLDRPIKFPAILCLALSQSWTRANAALPRPLHPPRAFPGEARVYALFRIYIALLTADASAVILCLRAKPVDQNARPRHAAAKRRAPATTYVCNVEFCPKCTGRMHRNAAIIPRTVGDFVRSAGNLQPATDPFVHKIRNHRANGREMYRRFCYNEFYPQHENSSEFIAKIWEIALARAITRGRITRKCEFGVTICDMTQQYHLYFTMDI